MTAARLFSVSGFAVIGGAVVVAAAMSNCGGSSGERTGGAGSTGNAGSSGTAGSTGSAGNTGTGGRFICPTDQTLDCAGAPLTLTGGHVTNLSMREWNVTDGKYCNASGLRGSVFSYSGPAAEDGGAPISSNMHGVDAPAENFRLTLMAGPGGYAGGGISFDHCVNASSFNALRFSAWVSGGDLTGCTFQAYLQTFEQRPTSQAPAGGCSAATCYSFPASPDLAPLSSTPKTFTVPFTMLTSSATHTNPVPGQIVGLQWQVNSGPALEDGGVQQSCMVEIRIDDVDFVTQ